MRRRQQASSEIKLARSQVWFLYHTQSTSQHDAYFSKICYYLYIKCGVGLFIKLSGRSITCFCYVLVI